MIAVVVPTIRPEQFEKFKLAWAELFQKHEVTLYTVRDGENPTVNDLSVKEVMGEYADLIYNFNDGVRNLGFAAAYKDGADTIISLDDDTEPYGDTIQDHLNVLRDYFPVTWMNTANEFFMRGFPIKFRAEAECVLSHGVWEGVADFDANTQLTWGTPKVTYKKMPVPRGVVFPICSMNLAFKRKLTPYIYQAPMFGNINRFADIWGGIEAKEDIDENDWCAVTGYATVKHERASNPFENLKKEALGVEMNELYGTDDYFALFHEKRQRWQQFLFNL